MPAGSKPAPGTLSKALAAILRELVAESGIAVTELASLVGISRRQMTRHLAADRVLDVEQLAAICEVLDAEPSDLLRRAGHQG